MIILLLRVIQAVIYVCTICEPTSTTKEALLVSTLCCTSKTVYPRGVHHSLSSASTEHRPIQCGIDRTRLVYVMHQHSEALAYVAPHSNNCSQMCVRSASKLRLSGSGMCGRRRSVCPRYSPITHSAVGCCRALPPLLPLCRRSPATSQIRADQRVRPPRPWRRPPERPRLPTRGAQLPLRQAWLVDSPPQSFAACGGSAA